MAYSFDPALPKARDRARAALGDIDSEDVLLQDETYDAVISALNGNEAQAQSNLARSIAAIYFRRADDEKQGDTENSFRNRGENFLVLANQLLQGIGSKVVVGQLAGPPFDPCAPQPIHGFPCSRRDPYSPY